MVLQLSKIILKIQFNYSLTENGIFKFPFFLDDHSHHLLELVDYKHVSTYIPTIL